MLTHEGDPLLFPARSYEYAAADNLTFAQLDVDGADIVPTVIMTYDVKERLATITRQTDTIDGPGGPDWITVVTTMSYDRDNRVLGIVHDRNVNFTYDATLNDYAYEWDDGNRLSQEISIDDELPKIYGYDDTNQLTSVELDGVALETFHYDANGNRDMTGWHAGAGNRLEYDPTYEYEYDDEGNLLTKIEKAGAEHVWTYSWDNRNRLVEVVETDDEAHVVADSKYTYDAYDRRIAMEVDPDGAGVAASQKLWMAWDNGNLWADLTTDGETTTVLTNYLYGTALDQLFAKVSENGEDPRAVDWYLTDLIGSVRDIANAEDGEIVDHIKYSAFGEVLDETAPSSDSIEVSNPHTGDRMAFVGRERLVSSSTYFIRARQYSASTGNFLSEDPIKHRGMDTNLKRYVENESVSVTDRTGLDSDPDKSATEAANKARLASLLLGMKQLMMLKFHQINDGDDPRATVTNQCQGYSPALGEIMGRRASRGFFVKDYLVKNWWSFWDSNSTSDSGVIVYDYRTGHTWYVHAHPWGFGIRPSLVVEPWTGSGSIWNGGGSLWAQPGDTFTGAPPEPMPPDFIGPPPPPLPPIPGPPQVPTTGGSYPGWTPPW